MTKYFIKNEGKMYGPIDEKKICNKVASGFFRKTCQISLERNDWLDLQQIFNLEEIEPSDHKIVPEPEIVPVKSQQSPSIVFRELISRKYKLLIIFIISIILLGGGIVLYFHSSSPNTHGDFVKVCQNFQSAVGLVTVTLEGELGGKRFNRTFPIGTAFAVSKNEFVTNSHIAYALKDERNDQLNLIVNYLVFSQAMEEGVKDEREFQQFCEKHNADIKHIRDAIFNSNIRVKNIQIRLSHTGGKCLSVSNVKTHPNYNPTNNSGEYDIAILVTDESVNIFFKLARKETLYALSAGERIAYLGFPMEGLYRSGNLDINKPEAIFKEGMIGKLSDFNNVFSHPEYNRQIIHSIPAAGGASGSPIFLSDGQVVAILWGVQHIGLDENGQRIASAVQHNFALRIDALYEVQKQKAISLSEWIGEKQ